MADLDICRVFGVGNNNLLLYSVELNRFVKKFYIDKILSTL